MDQSTIDRSWMYAKNLKRHSTEYRKGVINFMNATEEDRIRRNNDYMCCPCADCKNENMFDSGEDVHGHLIQRGFMEGYTCWVKHEEQESGSGAAADRSGAHNQEDENEHDMFIPSPLGGEIVDVDHDLLQDMLRDVEDPTQNERDGMKFSRLVSDSETPLYAGCKAKHTKLSVTLDLMKLKASSGWIDKSFTDLLGILKAMLPVENILPETTYEAKQVLCPLGLEVRRIHACPNDCILYHKQYADLDACPVCKASRYKRKKSADEGNKSKRGGLAKVVRYLPIIDRFKRIFANPNEAKLVCWHATERRNDDDKSTVQNSGVRIDAFQDQVGSNTYYGRIEEIWELNYVKFKVPLFRCRWVNLRTGVKADKEGFTLVDLSKVGYADEPFVLAKQDEQIFYIKDPSNKKMHIVRDGKRRIVGVDNVVDEEEYNHNLHARPHIDLDDDPQEPVPYARSDHTEGITL
uniref:Transposon protein, putative, CACTA, En/Spm sub-class n=1 Tax=Oryza glaberrima TaxID=4538 RepID=I1QTA5_ORYGL